MMTEEQVQQIIHRWSSGHDVWQGDTSWMGENPDDAYVYPPAFLTKKKGYDFRELPEQYAEDAKRYIAVICRAYPLQVRVLLGLPLWLRFCESWNATGDRKKAMRAI